MVDNDGRKIKPGSEPEDGSGAKNPDPEESGKANQPAGDESANRKKATPPDKVEKSATADKPGKTTSAVSSAAATGGPALRPGSRPGGKPGSTAAAATAAGQEQLNEEEERRRRVILALWLSMFAILIVIFVWVFFSLFGPGRNQVAATKKCLQCHEKQMARQLGSQYLHEPFGKELCTNCHVEPKTADHACDPNKRIYAVVNGQLSQVCTKCHTNAKTEMSKKFVHKPYRGKQCTDCHDPHGSQFEKLLVLPSQELCVSCHYGTDFRQIVQHDPVQKRNCIDCHEPHASDIEHDLVLSIGELCYSCHFRVAQQNLRPFKHIPFLNSQCTSCHKPHSSPEKVLLAREYNTLCESCHPNIGVDFQRVSHHPLGSDVMKTCGTCHLYHAADFRKLLPQANTVNCYQSQCHPGLQAYFDTSEHNSTVMGMLSKQDTEVTCSACHSPHGGNYQRLLTVDRYTVCLVCHADLAGNPSHGNFAHIWSPPYLDRWHGDFMWCGSCHNFHGSPNPAMRLALGDDLCLKCHEPKQLEKINR